MDTQIRNLLKRIAEASGVLVALSSVLVTPLSATGVVAFRTQEHIVLGADSAFSLFDTDGEFRGVQRGCKLHRAGDWHFVWGGHVAGGTDTDLVVTFGRELASARSLSSVTGTVHRFMRRHILTLAWHRLPNVRELGKVVLWAGVGRVHAGVPELGIYRAFVSSLEPVRLQLQFVTCPGACADGNLSVGQSVDAGGPISRLLEAPPLWLAPLTGTAARRLLALQAAATPQFVAAPFDVIEISATGTRWVDRDPKSSCAVTLER